MNNPIPHAKLKLDRTLPQPLYAQLAEQLVTRLDAPARATENFQLPSIRELARLTHLDRATIAHAYRELERQQLIYRRSTHIYQPTALWHQRRHPFPNIGVVIPCRFSEFIEKGTPYRHWYMDGIIDRAAEKNFSVLMLQLPPPEATEAEIAAVLDEFSQRLAGVIHLGARGYQNDPPLRQLMADRRIPQVIISATPRRELSIRAVVADLNPGVTEFGQELKKLGHQTIGIITRGAPSAPATDNFYMIYESQTRAERMRSILKQQNFSCPDKNLLCHACSYQEVFYQLSPLIRTHQLPDLFWCENDQIAQWTLMTLEKSGLKVPEDISVVGFDGCSPDPYSEQLTTLEIPFRELGSLAVDTLLEPSGQSTDPAALIRTLPVKFRQKQTLGCAASRSK